MENAVIYGNGIVGQATAQAFGIKDTYDIDPKRRTIELEEVVKRKYIFLCLPTPTISGQCFIGDIDGAIQKLISAGLSKDSLLIIRSTVTPGYSKHVQGTFGLTNVVSNPEFLSEDTLKDDALQPDLIVVGGDNAQAVASVVALYKGRFKYPEPVVTDSTTAEFMKYALNSFFAVKVVFANELFDGAQQLGANYEAVKKVLETHKWGTKNHLTIHHKGGRGAGGHCLPKDLEAFGNLIKSVFLLTTDTLNTMLLEGSKKV